MADNNKEVEKMKIDAKEVDKMKNDAKNVFSKAIRSISKSSATKQLIVGSLSGWTTGYVTVRVGKTAAVAIGGGIILIQIAQQSGYINIDWDKLKKKAAETTEVVEAKTQEAPRWISKVKTFARRNSCFAAGFVGGFLIGVAS